MVFCLFPFRGIKRDIFSFVKVTSNYEPGLVYHLTFKGIFQVDDESSWKYNYVKWYILLQCTLNEPRDNRFPISVPSSLSVSEVLDLESFR